MKFPWFVTMLLAIMTVVASAMSAHAASCESLTSLSLPYTTITSAEAVAAGAFTPPNAKSAITGLPAFCRVTATLKPSSDSDIRIEVWLPVAGWNGKFQPVGNGLWGGSINYNAMAGVLRMGSATASSDTGHMGPGASFALGHPEKLVDFIDRSFHETTVKGKAVIAAFYGSGPKLSLLHECGGGSRQALTEAQRYPEDFDAIMAGGLDTHTTHHTFAQMWVWQATHKTEEAYIPPEKYSAIHQAALQACDADDGVKDGIIRDPERCTFDPAVLLCKSGDSPMCLTAPQLEAARQIYTAPTNPRTGEEIFGPLMPGSELGWASQAGPRPFGYAVDFFKYLVFKDPNWDYNTRPVNFDSDVALADSPENRNINNIENADVTQFIDRGGKLLLFGGWSDTGIAPSANTDYYKALVAKMGDKARNNIRLFMVPDMGHCLGGNGRSTYVADTQTMLEEWKATGKAPDRVIVTHRTSGVEGGQMLVCPYPQVARYKGTGDAGDPASFTCQAP